MDPATSTAALSVLVKVAATFASGAASSMLRKRSRRWRVARTAANKAKERGIRISQASVRRWLARPDVQDQLRLGTATTVATATGNLAWLIAAETPEDRQLQAQELLFIILIEFIRAHDQASAASLSAAWLSQQIAAEGQDTRQTINTTSQAILDKLSDPQVFRDDLGLIHPWRGSEAEKVASVWPDIVTYIHTLVTTDDRGALLRQWESNPPSSFATAPAQAWCLFGELASDYGQPLAASGFIKRGIAAGAYPSNYWWARAVMAIGVLNQDQAQQLLRQASEDPHPLSRGLAAVYREDHAAASQAFSAWDAAPGRDRALKAVLLSASLAGEKELNRAIAVAIECADLEPSASGLALHAANLLLSRARFGPSDHPLADAGRALTLALRARNGRRTWATDSAAAVLVAVTAAGLSGDPDRAWRLTQAEPAGEATAEEARDPRIKREAAVLAAMTGRLDRANELAQDLGDPYVQMTIEGFAALSVDDPAAAERAWMRAYDLAPDDQARLVTASSLADLGGDMPDLNELAERHPEQVAELRTLHSILSAGEEKLQLLRARAHESARLAMSLADVYAARREFSEAARVLEDAGVRFNEPHIMRMAAARYQRAGDNSGAQRASESAITLGGPAWAGEFEARILLFEAHESQGHLAESTQQARRLVALEPDDVGVRWALIHCLAREGDADGAWNTLTPNGDPVDPRNQQEARTWIALLARYDTSDQFVNRALRMMKRWPDDEQILGIFIAQTYAGLRRDELAATESDLNALHEATRDYLDRFPNSSVFRSVPLGPEDDLLAPFADDLKAEFDAFKDVDEGVRSGVMPLGFLAAATGRSYAEAAIRRAAGMVRSHVPARYMQVTAELPAMLDSPVALDTTAAVTLALMDRAIFADLVGKFSRIHATDPAYHDARMAQEFLGLRSTLSVHWDPDLGGPRPVSISDDVADQLAEHSTRVSEILGSANRQPWPALKAFETLNDDKWTCLTTLDMALELKIPFWCDDYVLATWATARGLPTFGTVDLLRYLASTGGMNARLVEAAEAVLIRNYHVDLGFNTETITLAAAADSWEPRGTAFALTRPLAWANPEPVLDFLTAALTTQIDRSPDDLRTWIGAAAVGLVRDLSVTAASSNLQVLLGRLLNMPWMRPDRFPAVVAGVRQGLIERPELRDPLEPVLSHSHTKLVERHGHAVAAPLLLALVQFGSDEDRGTAARIILSA